MAYFDFYCTNIGNNNSEEIKGTCNSMCPQEEIELREREHLLHVLEVLGPVRKLVKCYSRSAADSNMVVPHLLRPYPVLKDTVQYLLLEVTKREDVSIAARYDFVNDRLRAVRQDMTIQRIPPDLCIHLLEPMVRFYVYFGYRLCEHPLKDYDPVLNKKYLLECLKWFLSCCDKIKYQEESKVDFSLCGLVSNMKIRNTYRLQCHRVLMESLYMLCNMDDVHPLHRYSSLPERWKRDHILKFAYQVVIANSTGNYIKVGRCIERMCILTGSAVCLYLPTLQRDHILKFAYQVVIANSTGNYIKVGRCIERMCILTGSAVCLYLPTLQRRAFQVMSHAYNSRNLTVPAAALRRWLTFNSDAEVIEACSHYGLKNKAGEIQFCRTDFKSDAAVLQPKRLLVEDGRRIMCTDIDHIFTYDSIFASND